MKKRSVLKITGGRYRGQQIRMQNLPGLRPTSSKIRQAIFSMLGNQIEGSFLDACGGSGIMALEALSRGADPVVICECRAITCRLIEENVRHFLPNICVRRGDGKKTIATQKWTIIFLDPPYCDHPMKWLPLAFQYAEEIVVFEHAVQTVSPAEYTGWERTTYKVYGNTAISIYEASEKASESH